MENATKALIMAGAILIAILLISVGIMILRSPREMVGQVDSVSSVSEVKMFNGQFENYIGTNLPAVQVRSLISTVRASNAKNSKRVILPTSIDDISEVTASYYNVSIPNDGYADDGYICKINITPTNAQPRV